MRTLFLIDGHNLLYRAFFGVPRLSSPDGTPTNAVLGFARALIKVLKVDRPDAVAAVFDAKGPTHRHVLYPAYKANRETTPEDLAIQIPLVREVIDALGVTRLEIPGVEADDVIGTLTKTAEAAGYRTVVISSDKDLYQLVSATVTLRDGLKERPIGIEQVVETFGVGPEKVVDLLALAGDPSDNIPGVPGIGEKTAAEMIREFGSIDEILLHVDRLKGAKRKKIEDNVDLARLCRTLVEIRRDVPLPVGLPELSPRPIDSSRAVALFRKLGFRKLIDDLSLDAPPPALDLFSGTAWGRGGAVESKGEATGSESLPLLGAPTSACSVPPSSLGSLRVVETGHVDGALKELGVERGDFVALLPPGAHDDKFAAGSKSCVVVLHARYFVNFANNLNKSGANICIEKGKSLLKEAGFSGGPGGGKVFDLLVAGYLLSPDDGTPTLSKLFARHLPSLVAAGEGVDDPIRSLAERADAILRLAKVLDDGLSASGLKPVFEEIEMPLLPVLAKMESAGIGIDPVLFAGLSVELAVGIAAIERKVIDAGGEGFNINSPKQMANLLFDKLGLTPVKKTKTGFSTDVEVLEALSPLHEIPALVLEYRTLAKIKSTYVDTLPKMVDPADGRIHTTFNQTVAATGRLSSSDPNLQNIPIRTDLGRRIRAGFVAPRGYLFVGADYSQIELRILAHLSGDDELVRRFRDGDDIHAATAAGIFGVGIGEVTAEQRRRAKVVNFGILYGMSAFGLSKELGVPPKEAKTVIDAYFDRFPKVRGWIDQTIEGARRDGYVTTILGRKRVVRDIDSANRVMRDAADRVAVNTPIQGSAADLIKVAMIRADATFRSKGLPARLILQVHDELIVEAEVGAVTEVEAALREAMEGAASLSVPLTVSVAHGPDWGSVH